MAKILVTGGNGVVGKSLCPQLRELGHEVLVLTRRAQKVGEFEWNWESGKVDDRALKDVDCLIHLAGETVGQRWTSARKRAILDSRVLSLDLLHKKMQQAGCLPKVLLCASAVGFYGTDPKNRLFTEEDHQGEGFLANVCFQLEQTAKKFSASGTRVVCIRTGVVLSNSGDGFLHRLKLSTRLGFLPLMGNGTQWVPWIDLRDLCGVYTAALVHPAMAGTYNAVAPEHLSNKALILELAASLKNKPRIISVPSFLLVAIFGEMSQLFLSGQRISCDKLVATGFRFRYATFKESLFNEPNTGSSPTPNGPCIRL